jgi:hypothetical protein
MTLKKIVDKIIDQARGKVLTDAGARVAIEEGLKEYGALAYEEGFRAGKIDREGHPEIHKHIHYVFMEGWPNRVLAKEFGIKETTLRMRLSRGYGIKEALTNPVNELFNSRR